MILYCYAIMSRYRKVFQPPLLLEPDKIRLGIDIIDVIYPHAHVAEGDGETKVLKRQDSSC